MDDPTRLNIADAAGRLLCPCCGFAGYSQWPAYDAKGGIIGTTICPCCLWEPGFDDDPAACGGPSPLLVALRAYRAAWTGDWRGKMELRPVEFDPGKQLSRLLEWAPYLR